MEHKGQTRRKSWRAAGFALEEKEDEQWKPWLATPHFHLRLQRKNPILTDDPLHFEILQAGYAKDLKKVYHFGTELKQRFHAPTFEFFHGNYKYPMDKNKITYEGKEIIGVDRNTFRILEKGFSEDKNRKYRFSQVLLEGI